MTLDDLIRLANYAGGTASDAQARGVSPAIGPPATRSPMSLQPSAPVAQPPGMPVPSLGDAVMGPAGALEHLAGNLPGNSIAGLLDLAGTILRGHSAYGDARKRAALNSYSDDQVATHTANRDAAFKEGSRLAEAPRVARIASGRQRIEQMQSALREVGSRMFEQENSAKTAQTPEELAQAKNLYARLEQQQSSLQNDLDRVTNQVSADEATLSPESMAYLKRLGVSAADISAGAQAFGAQPQAARAPAATSPASTATSGVFPSKAPRPPRDSLLSNGDLSPEGLDYVAGYLNQTGILLPMGMGNAATRAKVFNRAAQMMNGTGESLGGNRAGQAADTESLKSVQKLYDNATAFENTALRNTKVLKDAMARIRNTNSPLLNRPLREIDAKALGSEEVAAYRTALGTVQPEFARILSSPGASGVLSDAARKEGQGLLSGDYTLGQMLASIEVLRQDAENKRLSYRQQVDEIKGRIGQRGRPNPKASLGKIRVRVKATGQTGYLDSESEFDPTLYERVR